MNDFTINMASSTERTDGVASPVSVTDEAYLADVVAFQSGKVDAFLKLFDMHSKVLSKLIQKYTRDKEMTEDVFQETWIVVWSNRSKLKKPSAFRQWLFQIARYTAIRFLKQRNRRLNIRLYGTMEDLDSVIPENKMSNKNPRDHAVLMQFKAVFDEEVALLDPISQEIMVLKFVSDLTLEEISRVLDIPASTVSTKLNRALTKVRKRLISKGIGFTL